LLEFPPQSHPVDAVSGSPVRHPAARASPICPDFRRELKVLCSRRYGMHLAAADAQRDFPCASSLPHEALFVTRNFPGDVCGRRLSRVSRIEGIFFVLFFLDSSAAPLSPPRRRAIIDALFLSAILRNTVHRSEAILEQASMYTMISDGGVYFIRVLDAYLSAIRYRGATRRSPISRGSTQRSGSPRRN